MSIKSQKDFWSGLMFMAIGGGFAVGAKNYTVGTAARMGPGYFPMMIGIILAILGLVILINSLRKGPADGDKIGKWAWRPLFFVILANLLFGALLAGIPAWGIPHMGMVVAIIVLTFVSALGGDEFKFKEVLILSIVLAVGSYVAFIWGLNLQFPVWPSFISG